MKLSNSDYDYFSSLQLSFNNNNNTNISYETNLIRSTTKSNINTANWIYTQKYTNDIVYCIKNNNVSILFTYNGLQNNLIH